MTPITALKGLYKDNRWHYYFASYAPKNATPVYYKTGKTINIVQIDGSVRKAYMYGEHMFSYDLEEVEAYRIKRANERAELVYRNKLLKAINAKLQNMPTETLEIIVRDFIK